MYTVEIPKILYLALQITGHYQHSFFNTNDLATLANKYKKEFVRPRSDKKVYKYFEDTNFGGLRGNFSTLLTWRGFVKRGSKIVSTYSLGRDNSLVTAVNKGKIILDANDLKAHTNDLRLKEILESEAWLLTVRETQAHVKIMVAKNPQLGLTRDADNFPKDSVFLSNTRRYFIRSLVNNFVDTKGTLLEYSLVNLWDGNKFKKRNIHPLIVIPTKEDPWHKILAIKNEDLYDNKPLVITVNLITLEARDTNGNSYKLHTLEDALNSFSDQNSNIEKRLNYEWGEVQRRYCEQEVEHEVRKDDEFSNFLRLFLNWKESFSIDGRKVEHIRSISSGGPDVELIFEDGSTQKLELEHSWGNYLNHRHHKNTAFKNVWVFAEEEFNLEKILLMFSDQKLQNGDRVPDIFLSATEGDKKTAHFINWKERSAKNLDLEF